MSKQEGFPSHVVYLKRPKRKKHIKSKAQKERELKRVQKLRESTRQYALEHGIELGNENHSN